MSYLRAYMQGMRSHFWAVVHEYIQSLGLTLPLTLNVP